MASMNKRGYEGQHGSGGKKQKYSNDNYRNNFQPQQRKTYSSSSQNPNLVPVDHQRSREQIPASTGPKSSVEAFTPFAVEKDLPPLPPITDPKIAAAPFIHKSSVSGYDRTSTVGDLTYERLEFIGDAYLELIATRLIFHHFATLQTGAQSQVREMLVKNETLAEYSRAYGFDKRITAEGLASMAAESHGKGNKGLNKILGDVFEAYVAGVIISDQEHGFAVAEKWLTQLWAPKALEAAKDHAYAPAPAGLQQDGSSVDLKTVYDPTGKATLQKRIMGQNCKLVYEPYQESIELKGNQIGQNKHFVAVYLTGWGYEKELLGKGEGKNKVEAGNWAAVDAMHGGSKPIVEECEEKFTEVKKQKRKEKEERESKDAAAS